MEVKRDYLNKLKDLYKMDFLFYESTFIDFKNKLNNIYPKVKEEITNAYINLEPSQYKRFVETEINEINNLGFRTKDIKETIIKERFKEYNLTFFGIDSILKLSNESSLYSDLSENIVRQPTNEIIDDLYSLQADFLSYTKTYIADDIINYLNEININKKNELKSKNLITQNANSHPRIFKSKNAFKYFESNKGSVRDKNLSTDNDNFLSEIFKTKNDELIFNEYVGKYIEKEIKDFGFLFQAMLKNNLIHDMKHKKFIEFLKNKNHINDDTYSKLLIKGGFESYNKLASKLRIERLNTILMNFQKPFINI